MTSCEFFSGREDQNLRLKTSLSKLANVTFHEKLGSLQNTWHVRGAASLAEQAGLAEESALAARAAEIYKSDL